MKLKYYGIALFLSLFCIALSIVFFIPYGFNIQEEEKVFDEAVISVIAPNRGERKIELITNKEKYWLSCYGVEELCKGGNINKTVIIKNVTVLLNRTDKTNFLNGIFLEYYYNTNYHSNKKFNPNQNSLITVVASNAIFALKLAFVFLLISIFLFIKRI